ncbi:MAG TPA: RluA family pseudouridine synthase [Patescibacteria group bacterium]|jgi:23S rRNA pseudouridine1911/1915/1917 synthase|nr:RluA family pseudouridine synthase [Patescibacteria group bacterium]
MTTFIVEKSERLDKFLASQVEVSRNRVQKAIKQGKVSVNGKVVIEPDFTLASGSEVSVPEFSAGGGSAFGGEPEKLTASDLPLKVVFENADLAVIDKPAGLMVHPGAGRTEDTLAHALLGRFPDIEKVGQPHRPGIVHRLDEDTSGLILVAKTEAGYDYLKNLFLKREVQKEYLALVHGIPANLHSVIEVPIGKTASHTKMKAGSGKQAVTEYSVVAHSSGVDQVSLLRLKLHTGRTHQIRVHLSHIGHPIVGDTLYGAKFKDADSKLINRQFLHAYKLKFKLIDGTWFETASDLPEDLTAVLDKLGINYDFTHIQ